MFEIEPTFAKWEAPKNSDTRNDNSDRRIKIRLVRAVFQGVTARGQWLMQEQSKHINILELIALKFAILIFTQGKSVGAIHLQIEM